MNTFNLLSIAGSDSSGGAGIQADMKTFSALGCYGMSVITALTAQNTRGVHNVYQIPSDFVEKQMEAIFDDIRVDAVKIGMLSGLDIVTVVAKTLRKYQPLKVVLDPVMLSSHGTRLLQESAVEIMKTQLFPLVTVLTPNIPEMQALFPDFDTQDMEKSVKELTAMGVQSVVIKGGHMEGEVCTDTLYVEGESYAFSKPRIDSRNTHGTGCTFSAAIASFLAKGTTIPDAVKKANAYIHEAIKAGRELSIGSGTGPLQHVVQGEQLL